MAHARRLADLLNICHSRQTAALATVCRSMSPGAGVGTALVVGPHRVVSRRLADGVVGAQVCGLTRSVVAAGQPALGRFEIGGDTLDVFVEPVSPRRVPQLDEVANAITCGRSDAAWW
jgi:hypothetical protein